MSDLEQFNKDLQYREERQKLEDFWNGIETIKEMKQKMNGSDTPTEYSTMTDAKAEMHFDICETLNDIYVRKNKDYGDSFATLRNKFDNAILILLYDKLLRLETLITKKKQLVKDESIRDTLMDMANYCIMEIIEMDIGDANKK